MQNHGHRHGHLDIDTHTRAEHVNTKAYTHKEGQTSSIAALFVDFVRGGPRRLAVPEDPRKGRTDNDQSSNAHSQTEKQACAPTAVQTRVPDPLANSTGHGANMSLT
jgi:hypothetical protein